MTWMLFYTFENMGMTDAWTEHLEVAAAGEGLYDLRVYNPPVRPDDEPDWIEWQADSPVSADQLLDVLMEGISARGLRKEVALEAALSLRKELPATDAQKLERSLVVKLAQQPSLLEWLKKNREATARALLALAGTP